MGSPVAHPGFIRLEDGEAPGWDPLCHCAGMARDTLLLKIHKETSHDVCYVVHAK